MKFKKIKLNPSVWELHILVSKDHIKSRRFLKKEYRLKDDDTWRSLNFVQTIDSGNKSKHNGESLIFMHLSSNKDYETIVHEIVHVMHRMQNLFGVDLGWDSQEWQALMQEYIFKKIISKKKWKKITFSKKV